MCGSAAGGVTPGPTEYGFNDAEYCIPNTSANEYYQSPQVPLAYPSPDGSAANEGCGGALLQPFSGDTQHYGPHSSTRTTDRNIRTCP
jgi:hypothetical protein